MPSHRINSFLAVSLVAAIALFGPTATAQSPQPAPRYVKAEAVNVRGGPGVSNSIVTVLNLGAEVSIYVTKGDWARISGPGQPEKWIYAPLLQDHKPQPVKAANARTAPKPSQKAAAKPDSHQKREPEAPSSKKAEHPTAQKEKQDGPPAR